MTSESPPHIKATLAFVFDTSLDQVLLIRKQKPVGHAGLLNGLGGKVEPGESHLDCVIREVHEEAGILIPKEKWIKIGTLGWDRWKVSMWSTQFTGVKPQTFPEPDVNWYTWQPFPEKMITNLTWLIPLSVDVLTKKPIDVSPHLKISYY
jgi:8-oxo-dGTP diphosphatase